MALEHGGLDVEALGGIAPELADGQRIVRDFGKDRFGEGLYNDAAYARKYAN
jgi:hypothetical protein